MTPEERKQLADRLLDSALTHYSDAEPSLGMESRILANVVANEAKQSRLLSWVIWVPVASAAAVALSLGLSALRRTETPAPPPSIVANAPAATDESQSHVVARSAPYGNVTRHLKLTRSRATSTRTTKDPVRKPQFSMTARSTEQDRLLAAYLDATPVHELLAVAADQREWRKQVQQHGEAAEHQPEGRMNNLPILPLTGGSTEAGASGTRQERP